MDQTNVELGEGSCIEGVRDDIFLAIIGKYSVNTDHLGAIGVYLEEGVRVVGLEVVVALQIKNNICGRKVKAVGEVLILACCICNGVILDSVLWRFDKVKVVIRLSLVDLEVGIESEKAKSFATISNIEDLLLGRDEY